ncbi:NADH:flavin oxidoreductase [Ruegeria atlantica]|uniref:NADH:flavin oxidoreductase n=1 Tax=Ruegeria atlantica TaxID=81569 RepID=UPI00147C5447|nr:NADH:flavin oxidoreductase [Ruegeria atlantica]
MPETPYKSIFQPFRLGHLTLKNRIISTSHAPAYAENGMPRERYQRYHEEKAAGGLSLTMFGGASSVSLDSPPSFGQLNLASDDIVPHLRAFSGRIHAHDVGLMCQLSHAGRRTRPTSGNWLPTIAPSPIREPAHGAIPKSLEHSDIRRVIEDYSAAAQRCLDGGIDGIELLASGHLIGQFWSPLSNQRSDEYGGSFDNRIRFGLEALEGIRARIPDDFVVSLRLSVNEFIDGGISEDEGIAIAKAYAESGLLDCLNVSGGANWTKAGVAETVPSMAFPSGRFIELAGKVRRAVQLPVMHAAGIADLATANFAVAEGHVDLVGMTRAHIADPHLVRKHLAGQDDAIRPCVGAGYCIDRIYRGGDALCLHNPVTGREKILSHSIRQAPQKRKIVVVGAGPAGLEAARICAERGHKVVMFEAQSQPGGQVNYIVRTPWRSNMIGIPRWQYDQCEALGVDFRFNVFAEKSDILDEHPDVVLLANGGMPESGMIDGAEQFGFSVWDVMSGEFAPNGKVLVYDETGSQSGPSCAEFIAGRENTKVDLITPDRMIAENVGVTNHAIHLRNLHQMDVKLLPDLRLKSINREGTELNAVFVHEYSGKTQTRCYHQIIVEAGTVPDDDLFDSLKHRSENNGALDYNAALNNQEQPSLLMVDGANGKYALFRIGDAVSDRGLHAAVLDSHRLCQSI